jgi:hypothetical protein
MKLQQPQTSLLDLPTVADSALMRMLKRELLLAFIPFMVLAVGSFITTRRLPPGKSFILESRGIGVWYDVLLTVVAVAFFGALYALPSLWARRRSSITYRIVLFLTLTLVVFGWEAERYIAVVQNGNTFTFLRRVPFGSVTIAAGDLTIISAQKSSPLSQLRLEAWPAGSRSPRILLCQHVWAKDKRTIRVMDELGVALRAARDMSHTPVAPSTAPSPAAR